MASLATYVQAAENMALDTSFSDRQGIRYVGAATAASGTEVEGVAIMRRIFLTVVVVASLFLPAANAGAGMIAGTTPASNDFIPGWDGWYGANLYLTGVADIKVTYINKEAGYTNTFNFGGGAVEVVTGTTSPGTVFNFINVPAGLLNFLFTANSGASSVANGANITPAEGAPNFFVSFQDSFATGGTIVTVALDDGGAGPDDNHDDLIVRLEATGGSFSVPDGGVTVALLGFALMGLGVLRRRFGA